MKIFSTKIQDIIGQVRDKLSKDARDKDPIVQQVPRSQSVDQTPNK